MESLELLIDVLQNKNPALFLGAGFSLGAINKDGKKLPSGGELAKELYDKFLLKRLSDNEKSKLFNDEDKKFQLKYVCVEVGSLCS